MVGASPRLFRPTYAGANVGHPSVPNTRLYLNSWLLACRQGFQLGAGGFVGEGYALGESGSGLPAQRLHAGYVEELLRGSVGAVRVEDEVAGVAQRGADLFCQLAYRDVFAGADVD